MSTLNQPAPLPAKQSKLVMVLLGLTLPLTVALKMGIFLLFAAMLPTLAAFALLRKSRGLAHSIIAAFNIAGAFPSIFGIFMRGGTPRALMDTLTDPTAWCTIYGTALLGWAVVWLSPQIAMLFLEEIHDRRMKHLDYLQKKLVEEWGEEVKGKSK